jgi:hypothetical protein
MQAQSLGWILKTCNMINTKKISFLDLFCEQDVKEKRAASHQLFLMSQYFSPGVQTGPYTSANLCSSQDWRIARDSPFLPLPLECFVLTKDITTCHHQRQLRFHTS